MSSDVNLCYLRENWLNLFDRFSLFDGQLENLIYSVYSHFNTQERIGEVNIIYFQLT